LEAQSLFWDETRGSVYAFGGKLSPLNGEKDPKPNLFYENRSLPQTMWCLSLDQQPWSWFQALGPKGQKEFPSTILQSVSGASISDKKRAYYIGGGISALSTPAAGNDTKLRNTPGFITFDFATQTLTNSTNDGNYFASQYTDLKDTYLGPGRMFNAPFGVEGVLILVGGRTSWEYLTIFNKEHENWFEQQTTGDIPPLYPTVRTYCVLAALDKVHSTIGM
jgi:hypothetical protein